MALGRVTVAGLSRLQGIGLLVRVSGVGQDQQEFAEFYAAVRDDCLRIVLISVGDRQHAEDLVAEAFTKAWMTWRKVRQHPVPQAWIIRTALNAHVSWWRRHGREEPLAGYDETAATPQHLAPDSSLLAALRRLPLRQRQVIALRVLLDLDTATTAQILSMPSGTVASHLHRGLAALRREFPALDDQERIT
jgi:RNA polymerase sigma-70 factor (ECF subfamily)